MHDYQRSAAEENVMRTILRTAVMAAFAMVVLSVGFVSGANAQCGGSDLLQKDTIQLQSWDGEVPFATASILRVSSQTGSEAGIVGFWKVKFVAEGNVGIPDGTLIDNGFAQWHSDGTEIMNSSKAPATGSFCLGVYQKSGPSSYQLNHFALGYDSSGNFIGPAQIQEGVTVNRKANQYTGTFTIDQYDPMGNPLAHVAGNVSASRVTVNTPIGDVL
ncbi:MAG: hypothetical protein WA571_18190 [Candidatus Binatus sp.]